MKQSFDLRAAQEKVMTFLERYHSIIFFVFIGIALMVALVTVVSIINSSAEAPETQAQAVNKSFDTATIEKLKQLNLDDSQSKYQPPSGRINPFVE